MKQLSSVTLMVLSLLGTSALNVDAQGSVTPTRRVRASAGTPLTAWIRPGEEALVVESADSRPLEVVLPPNVSMIQARSHSADAIVIAEIVTITPNLTESADWITSTVTASVIEVFKASPPWIPETGGEFSFKEDSGELVVAGGTRVTAVMPWAKPVELGRRYLIFIGVDREKKTLVVGPTATYEIGDSRLLRLAPSVSGPDSIEQASPVDVFVGIRDAVRSVR